MKPIESFANKEINFRERWGETQVYAHNVEELQRAVRYNGPKSPCVVGCRSVCWKAFLLFRQEKSGLSWSQILRDARKSYAEQSDYLLRFIKHPEALAQLTIDPLTDDPESPWNTIRQDEIVRTEIQQDVQRLPDDVNYHQPHIQSMILDILFVYCKLFPSRGGYRQGMHELLAPIVYVIEQDALDRSTSPKPSAEDELMYDMLDANFIEHDAFMLFTCVMDSAQSFYEVRDGPGGSLGSPTSATPSFREQKSSIVERSKQIHEVCLAKIDSELATHLTSIEILPQIFLIRWVRLLFSREFPFDQFLLLWDTIFSVDPAMELIDLICVAMLVRIRWELLEADYSVCLQLLLKYPPPSEEHGPQTFVDDALYLQTHMNPSGGSTIIMKYSGRLPSSTPSIPGSRPETPSRLGALRHRGFGTNSPSRLLQQAGVEALLAKGAKGVIERGEKLGINQAVRDAMGEIRKNMQTLQDPRQTHQTPREINATEGGAQALTAMEQRNKQLASMLGDTVASLKALSSTVSEDAKAKIFESIEVAAAKIQFVQIYLEDPTMDLPLFISPPNEAMPVSSTKEPNPEPKGKPSVVEPLSPKPKVPAAVSKLQAAADRPPKVPESPKPPVPPLALIRKQMPPGSSTSDKPTAAPKKAPKEPRPKPIPTRSTLAQSSFSWMLEPDEPVPKQKSVSELTGSPPAPHQQQQQQLSSLSSSQSRRRGNASREKNAFLFGEATDDGAEKKSSAKADEIFGLETFPKGK